MDVVLELLREGVNQPREASHYHAHREILALDVAGADMRLVGRASDRKLLDAGALGRAVLTLTPAEPVG